jgi:hypothetical protein
MAQRKRDRDGTSAEEREQAEDRFDLDHLVDVTLGGFGLTPDLASDSSDVLVDALGRAHQIEPARLIADKRQTNAARCQVLFSF